MKVKDQDILNFLHEHVGWTSAALLAVQFKVTERTIRSHIAQINVTRTIVISGTGGYRLNQTGVTTTETEPTTLLTHSSNIGEKIFVLLFTLNSGQLMMTDLMEKTFFSESTLRNGISNFNRKYKHEGIKITIKSGNVKVLGEEFDRRKLYHRLIGNKLKQVSTQDLTVNIQKLIPRIPLDRLKEMVTVAVAQQDLVVNGYELNDLLLHYAIAINRIFRGQSYDDLVDNSVLSSRPEYEITNKIVNKVSEIYQIKFNSFEVQALTLALIGKTITKDTNELKFNDLQKYVSQETITVSLKVIADVDKEYDLQLKESSFLVRFIIHINNMLMRKQYRSVSDSSNFEYLKKTYPFIYDLALYVLDDFSKRLGLEFNPEESVYLLLHLGAFLNRNQDNKINTILIAPDYYGTNDHILQQITTKFGDELAVLEMVGSPSQCVSDLDKKLILTTVDIEAPVSNFVVKISPIIGSLDIRRIRQKITSIQHQLKVKTIIEALRKTSSVELFFVDQNFKTKQDCLVFGVQTLQQHGFVNSSFIKDIEKREKMASTAFGDVAIPHTLEMNAHKTGILIMTSKTGIQWDDTDNCHLIMMIAVNGSDVKMFSVLLQSLISVLSIRKNVTILQQSNNYEQFMTSMANLLEENDDLD